jgi:hypothetical protein
MVFFTTSKEMEYYIKKATAFPSTLLPIHHSQQYYKLPFGERGFLEKLIVADLVKIFLAFYGIQSSLSCSKPRLENYVLSFSLEIR